MQDKKFYKLIKEKREEIDSLNISYDEKMRIYQLTNETIQRILEGRLNQVEATSSLLEGLSQPLLKHLLKTAKPKSSLEH